MQGSCKTVQWYSKERTSRGTDSCCDTVQQKETARTKFDSEHRVDLAHRIKSKAKFTVACPGRKELKSEPLKLARKFGKTSR